MKIGVSACLLGYNVRYNGSNKKNNELISLLTKHDVVAICPEQLAGFDVPHNPIEIRNDSVFDSKGNDYTNMLSMGSKKAYDYIKECDLLLLKSKSPSCGYSKIYDGSFRGKLVDGHGIFTRLAINNRMKIYTEEDIDILRELL